MKNLTKKILGIVIPVVIGLNGISHTQETPTKSQRDLYETMILTGIDRGDKEVTKNEYLSALNEIYEKTGLTRTPEMDKRVFDGMDYNKDEVINKEDGFNFIINILDRKEAKITYDLLEKEKKDFDNLEKNFYEGLNSGHTNNLEFQNLQTKYHSMKAKREKYQRLLDVNIQR